MKVEVAKRRTTDPTFTYRKLKMEMSQSDPDKVNSVSNYASRLVSNHASQSKPSSAENRESTSSPKANHSKATDKGSFIPKPTRSQDTFKSHGAEGRGPPMGRGSMGRGSEPLGRSSGPLGRGSGNLNPRC